MTTTTPALTPLQRFKREYQSYHELSSGRRQEQVKAIASMAALAEKAPEDCDADDVRAYLGDLSEHGRHVNTIRKELNMLRPWFNWGWEAGLIDADTLLRVQRVAAPRNSSAQSTPKPYTKKELGEFRVELDRAWPTVDDKFWARWKRGTSHFRRVQPHMMRIQIEAIVALALHCGMRRQEIFRASLEDIHYDNEFVVIRHAKGDIDGDKEREVKHTNASREAVRAWIELRTILGPSHDSVWLSLAWESVALRPMRKTRFNELLTTIQPKGRWHLHRFRHTAGTEWLRAIRRLEIVQKLLGHANLQQTLAYAKLVRDDVHREVSKSELQFEEAVGAR